MNHPFVVFLFIALPIGSSLGSVPDFSEMLGFSEKEFGERAAFRMLDQSHQGASSELEFLKMEEGSRVRLETSSAEGTSPEDDLALLAKKSANPVSDVWLMWLQNDTTQLRGDATGGDRWLNSTKFQPVMSFPVLGGDWNMIVRPVLQYQSAPLREYPTLGVGDPWGRTSGFGDSILLTLLGPNREDGLIWGAGMSQIFPTASSDILGFGKWAAGPAALIARIAPEPGGGLFESSNMGLLAQHWWSYGGDSNRTSVNRTDIQYFFNYRATPTSLIGMAPNIQIDWSAPDFSDAVTFPVGLGYSNIYRISKLPIRVAAEIQYSVIAPDDVGSRWNFRLLFIPILGNPFK